MDKLRKNLGYTIATFFGSGLSPKAPGTMGSLAALPFAWFLWQLPAPAAWAIFALTFAVGTWAAGVVVKDTGVQDNQCIVIDEVLGIFVVTAVCPRTLVQYAAAFVFFRLFDITKLWPVSVADRKIKGGFGVIFDDILAGIYALLAMLAFQHFFGTL